MRRHGDKGREMKLVSFQAYVEAAEKLITENPLNYKVRSKPVSYNTQPM